MEKVRPWCGQPSDRGWLKNRTEQADNRPIIGAPLIIVTATSTHKCEILKTGHTMHATVC